MFVTSKKMTAAVLGNYLAMSLSACSNWSKWDRKHRNRRGVQGH